MLVDIILIVIICILLWRMFKKENYSKMDFYKDIQDFCNKLIKQIEKFRDYINSKCMEQKNGDQKDKENLQQKS